MSEQFITDKQFEKIIANIISLILECTEEEKKKIRINWPEEGQPAFLITDNMVFINGYEVDDMYNRQREHQDTYETSPDAFARETSYTRVMLTNIILYGPLSFENAQKIRDGFFAEEHRITLAKNKIYMIPDNPSPKRVPEYFEGRWWKRYDISLRFNMLTTKESTIERVESAEIVLLEGDGGSEIETIEIAE